MPTKGASNRYGNSRGGRQGHPTEHTNFPWAKDFNKNTITHHFDEHGSEVGAPTKTSYISKAVSFANKVDRKNNVSFVDKNGSTYKYSKSTGEFAIINKKGFVITYFKPKDGYNYYLKQKKEKKR